MKELTQILKIEEENNQNVCKICLSKEIDTVFLNCAHRVMCRHCAHESVLQSMTQTHKCPICRAEIQHAIHKEHARCADDVLIRRCRLAMVDAAEAERLSPLVNNELEQM